MLISSLTPIASDTSFETDFGFVCTLPTWQTAFWKEKERKGGKNWAYSMSVCKFGNLTINTANECCIQSLNIEASRVWAMMK